MSRPVSSSRLPSGLVGDKARVYRTTPRLVYRETLKVKRKALQVEGWNYCQRGRQTPSLKMSAGHFLYAWSYLLLFFISYELR